MTWRAHRLVCGWALMTMSVAATAGAQVFTVGEKTATADVKTDFSPTRVELPDGPMTERGRRDLVRNLEAEQGFARHMLPLGTTVTLVANGNVTPGGEEFKRLIFKKGTTAAPGDRVEISKLEVKGDRIVVDLNGGPYVKHRFMRHIQLGVGDVMPAADIGETATGCRIVLVFEGGVPEVSAPEVKALLEPLVDFGVKTGEQAYAETLPPALKSAIAAHEVKVGMDHRMVLAALGQPESKVRETTPEGQRYEEWIYGHQPQMVQFVRFVGDRVSQVKVAEMGKAIVARTENEVGGYADPGPQKVIAVANGPEHGTDGARAAAAPPTLKAPGETLPDESSQSGQRKVQMPAEHPLPGTQPTVPPGTTGPPGTMGEPGGPVGPGA